MCFGDESEAFGFMETSVVEYDHRAFGKFGQQDFFEPFVKYGAIAHAGEPQRSEQHSHQQTCDDADACGAISGTCSKAALTFGAAAIGIGLVIVDACFIDPYPKMLWYFRQLL